MGFGALSLSEANGLAENDWMLIALSHASERDMRDYVAMWGLPTSALARSAVSSLGFPAMPLIFYAATRGDYCAGLNKPGVPIDGSSPWPL